MKHKHLIFYVKGLLSLKKIYFKFYVIMPKLVRYLSIIRGSYAALLAFNLLFLNKRKLLSFLYLQVNELMKYTLIIKQCYALVY